MKSSAVALVHFVAVLSLSGCDGGSEGSQDAAPVAAAIEVTCPTRVDRQITETLENGRFRFAPVDSTVRAGTIIIFRLGPDHNAVSNDGLFKIEFGGTQCIKFNKVGTYVFGCQAHGFMGSVIVTP